jgi:5-guanidino-2-oxopentanoate decarboxylase
MDIRGIARVGVDGINPDFAALARACHCHGVDAAGIGELQAAFTGALAADRPTVIVYHEQGG